jgi:hypothetical protein
MRGRKFIAFALTAMLLGVAGTGAALLAADLYVHHRAERSAGLNRWGYRGPVAPRKQPGEVRVVMLGGSTTFGYGVLWQESIPALLEGYLRQRPDGATFRTINLGFNNEGAYASLPTLQDYAWLDYDIVVLYHGYNDSLGDPQPNTAVYRRESPVFRLTGYYPILPLALREKAMALRSGGNIEAAYQSARDAGAAPKVTFTPNAAERTSAAVLEAVSQATAALGGQMDRVAPSPSTAPATSDMLCAPPWVTFCDSMYRTVHYARSRGAAVAVVAQPCGKDGKMWTRLDDQRAALQGMIARRFGGDPGTRFVDLSAAVDPTDAAVTFDGMHLKPEGNHIVARALVEPVVGLAAQRASSSR